MTRTLDRLERDGLVERHRDAADRRQVSVQVTDAGQRVYAQALAIAGAETELLGDVVDVAALRANLLAIIGHLTTASRA